MNSDDRLPIPDEVEEVRARGEDRLIDFVVPRLDQFAELVNEKSHALREFLTRRRAS